MTSAPDMGWKLLPPQITEEMRAAVWREQYRHFGAKSEEMDILVGRKLADATQREIDRAGYAGLLSAAPEPPRPAPVERAEDVDALWSRLGGSHRRGVGRAIDEEGFGLFVSELLAAKDREIERLRAELTASGTMDGVDWRRRAIEAEADAKVAREFQIISDKRWEEAKAECERLRAECEKIEEYGEFQEECASAYEKDIVGLEAALSEARSSSTKAAEAMREAAAQSIEGVWQMVSARPGSSIYSALELAQATIRNLPLPNQEGGSDV